MFHSPPPMREAGMAVTLDQSGVQCLVRLDGEITIASAAELKRSLLEALASGKALSVELAGASGLDVTGLQLLWAAEREARRSGVQFTIEGRVPEEIVATAADAGIEKFPFLHEGRPDRAMTER